MCRPGSAAERVWAMRLGSLLALTKRVMMSFVQPRRALWCLVLAVVTPRAHCRFRWLFVWRAGFQAGRAGASNETCSSGRAEGAVAITCGACAACGTCEKK